MKSLLSSLQSKISYYSLILICSIGLTTSLHAQRFATNLNPSSIQELKYSWSEFKAEGSYTKKTPVEKQWFSKYTALKPGYIRLKDGSFMEGELEIRYRYNQASEEKVRNSEGVKVAHPDGWKGIHAVYLTVEGERKEYYLKTIKSYGYQFNPDEWTAAEGGNPLVKFNSSTILFKNGDIIEGKVRLEESQSGFELTNYKVVYYHDEESKYVKPYPAREVASINVNVGDAEIELDQFRGYLIEAPLYYKAFSNDYKKYKLDPPLACTMVDDDGREIKGEVIFDKGKKKKKAYFITENKRNLIDLKRNSFSVLNAKIEGKDEHINFFNKKFMRLDEIREFLTKKESLFPGEIVLEGGGAIKGEVYFMRMPNAVKSYRFIYGYSIIPEGKNYLQRVKDENIDYVKVNEGGKEITYIQVGEYYEDQSDFVESLKSTKTADPLRQLQPGYLMLEGNKKVVGQIASSPPSTIFFVGDDGVPVRYKADEKNLMFYVQTYNGEDLKFVGLQKRSNILNNPFVFQKIEEPWGKYSYYKNPYPTHLRKGMTSFAVGAAGVAANEIQEEMAYHGAKDAAKREMKESGSAINAARESDRAYRSIKNTQMIEVDENAEGGIFFEEYVVFNNEGEEIHNVYKKNAEEEMSKILSNCGDYSSLPENTKKRYTSINNIGEAVRYLNSCK